MLQQSKQAFGTDPVHCKHACKRYKSFDPELLLLGECAGEQACGVSGTQTRNPHTYSVTLNCYTIEINANAVSGLFLNKCLQRTHLHTPG